MSKAIYYECKPKIKQNTNSMWQITLQSWRATETKWNQTKKKMKYTKNLTTVQL